MVLKLLGDGLDRSAGVLDLPEGAEQALPAKSAHRRGARRQVAEAIELARTHGEQAGQLPESHASRCTALEPAGGGLKPSGQDETGPAPMKNLGHDGPAAVPIGHLSLPMKSTLELGQRAPAAPEPGMAAIQDDQLPGIPIQAPPNLQRTGNDAHRGIGPFLDSETVDWIETEHEQAPGRHMLQAPIFQTAGTPPGS